MSRPWITLSASHILSMMLCPWRLKRLASCLRRVNGQFVKDRGSLPICTTVCESRFFKVSFHLGRIIFLHMLRRVKTWSVKAQRAFRKLLQRIWCNKYLKKAQILLSSHLIWSELSVNYSSTDYNGWLNKCVSTALW